MAIAISDVSPRIQYTATAGQTSFSVPFEFFADSNLVVQKTAISNGAITTLTLAASPANAAQYSASGAGVTGGGSITLGGGATVNDKYTISRNLPIARTTDFATTGIFPIDSLNTELDKIIAMMQQQGVDINLSPRASSTTSTAYGLIFPELVANKILTVNSAGDALEFDQSITDVSAVAAIAAEIVTVAGIDTEVTTVSGIASDVTAVANDATDIGAVAGKATEIGRLGTADAVADMAILGTADVVNDMNVLGSSATVTALNLLGTSDVVSDMNTLATADIIADMNTLGTADVVSDMNVLGTADVVSDMNSLSNSDVIDDMAILGASGVVTNISTVAGISTDITAVAGKTTEISRLGTVDAIADMNVLGTADVVTDMNTLATADVVLDMNTLGTADVVSDMNTLASSSNVTNMNTLAGISSDITTVAGINANVTTVGNNNTNVTTVATNITGVNSFADRYRVASSAPSTSLDSGDLYFDTTADILKVYGSSGWQSAGSSVNGTSARFTYTITGTPTTVTGSDDNSNTLSYDSGFIDVFLNGVKQVNGVDITVTSGSSIVFATALANNDIVDVVAYGTFSLASLNASNLSSGTVPSARLSLSDTDIPNLDSAKITTGTIATARLGSGTASSTTFLAGDQTYKTVSGTTINNNADNRIITGSGTANTLEGESNLTFDGTLAHINSTASGNTLHTLLKLETDGTNDGSGITIDTRTAHTRGEINFLDGTGSYDSNYVFKTATGSQLATPTEKFRVSPTGATVTGDLTVTGSIVGGGLTNTPAFHATMSTQTLSDGSNTLLNFNTVVFDTNSNYDTTNKRFTPTVAGKYFIHVSLLYSKASSVAGVQVRVRKNGSDAFRTLQAHFYGNDNQNYMASGIISCNGSGDYIDVSAQQDSGSSVNVDGSTTFTFFQGYKLIGA